MKFLSTLIFILLIAGSSFAQSYIDGPANIRENPDGKVIISLNGAVSVFVMENNDKWNKISFSGLIKNDDITNNTIQQGAIIFDSELNSTGKFLTDYQIKEYYEESETDGYKKINFELYTYENNLKELAFEELIKKKKLIVSDQANANLVIFKDNGLEFVQKTDINYNYTYFFDGKDIIRYLIRQKAFTKSILDSEGANTRITLTFYPNLSEKDTFSYTKNADRFELREDFLISTQYGCCGAEDYSELSSFPDNKTFLEFNSRYYVIDIPNTKNKIFFGFNIEPRYKNMDILLLGVLNYSFNYCQSGKIEFYAANKEQFENANQFTPEMEFITSSEKDEERKFEEYSELVAWSFNQVKNTSELNGLGLKVIFSDPAGKLSREYDLIIHKGKIAEKKIIVDFDR